MKKKYIIIFLSLVLHLSLGKIQAQQVSEKMITVESVITDDAGNPIPGAAIYGYEGAVRTITDASGKFTITVPEKTDILVEAEGYKSNTVDAEFFIGGKLALQASVPMFGKNDQVYIAYGRKFKGEVAGAVSVLDPKGIVKYDNIQSVSEALNGRIPGMLGSSNIRGIGTPVYLIDGLPRNPEFLDISEIEEITVLKDVNSAILYGSQALNGVVMITTKRGEAFKKQVNVWGHYGLALPRALPKYLSSADYMQQYNIARNNDGLPAQYSDATIENYRSGNPYRYPNTDYYSDEYLRSLKPFSKVMVDLSGGNERATYYSNLGWENQGNLLNFGTGKDSHINQFNARGNVDLKITDWIKTSIDAVGFLNNDKQPLVRNQDGGILINGYWSQAATLRPDLFSPLLPIDLMDPDLSLLKSRKNDIDGKYLAGGNSVYLRNPITDVYLGGELTLITRNFSFTNRIDVDLSSIVPGLGFHTNISFDYLNYYYQYIQNNYSVYQATWDASQDRIIGLTKFGEDSRTGNQNVGSASSQRRFGFYLMFDYDRTFGGVHHVSGNLLGYGSNYKVSYNIQANKYTNLGLRLSYDYAHKYIADFSGAVVSSSKLHPDNRVGFSPSLGLAWVISSEDFMSSVSFVDFLKFKVSGGIMNTDNFDFYLYDAPYDGIGTFYWYEGAKSRSGIAPTRGENKNLFYEKRKDVNIGLEGELFNRRLAFDAYYFNNIHDDIVIRPLNKYPSYDISDVPYENYNKNVYRGFELGLSWQQNFGDFAFMAGGNILYSTSERLRVDEIYQNDYQYRKGHPVDARFGLVSNGFFMSQGDIDAHEYQSFGAVKPGDIKYIDQNNDNIVDSNDERAIGRWQAPFSFGINLKLSYKRLTLFARGTGRTGADGYLNSPYYWAQGDAKYSGYMLNNWTEATKNTATYPRLSTTANNNNFRSSSFWLYKDDFFNLDRIQLTYDVPIKPGNKLTMKSLSVFLNASSILTISKAKDIRILNIDSEPQYRSFSIGLKTSF